MTEPVVASAVDDFRTVLVGGMRVQFPDGMLPDHGGYMSLVGKDAVTVDSCVMVVLSMIVVVGSLVGKLVLRLGTLRVELEKLLAAELGSGAVSVTTPVDVSVTVTHVTSSEVELITLGPDKASVDAIEL